MYTGQTPWQTSSSFGEPVPIPTGGPLADPLVCFSLSREWLPVILGALLQLAQPAAWAAADEAARTAVLLDVQDLLAAVGTAEDCIMPSFRFVACTLQVSYDGGATWADVPGWDTWAAGCFTGPEGPEGPTGATGETGATGPSGPLGGDGTVIVEPPNPEGDTTLQQACNIATQIADVVIKAAINQAVTSVEASAAVYDAVAAIIDLIPGVNLVAGLIVSAGAVLVTAIAAGTVADYTAALADDTLWADIRCAIYLAIRADGFVTDANFAAVAAAIAGVTYSNPAVITTIATYVNAGGAAMLEAAQLAGSLYQGDCSLCDVSSGNALSFNSGGHSVVTMATDVPFNAGDFTVGMWINTADATYSALWLSGYNPALFPLATIQWGANLNPNVRDSTPVDHLLAASTAGIRDAANHLIMWAVTQSVGQELYVDGTLVASGTLPAMGSANAAGGATTIGGGTPGSFTGLIWGVAAYVGTALGSAQAAEWFTNGPDGLPAAGYTHYWPFDEGIGLTAHDMAGGDNGTLSDEGMWATHP